jgi:hypothetical protein
MAGFFHGCLAQRTGGDRAESNIPIPPEGALLTTAAMDSTGDVGPRCRHDSVIAGRPPGSGFSLPIVYLVWLAIVTFC